MKKELIILHGALGSSSQFQSCIPFLEDSFNLHFIDFPGHGNNNNESELNIENCAYDLQEKIKSIPEPYIFGYSMGGYVALWATSKGLIKPSSIITLATKFAWSSEFAAKEVEMMQLEKLQIIAPAFIENLKLQHGNKWETLLNNTRQLMKTLGKTKLLDESTLALVTTPTCISVGFKDKMVSVEESLWAARNIPKAELEVFPKLQHPAERINWAQVSAGIKNFFGNN